MAEQTPDIAVGIALGIGLTVLEVSNGVPDARVWISGGDQHAQRITLPTEVTGK